MLHLALIAALALQQAPAPSDTPAVPQTTETVNPVRSRAWIPAAVGGAFIVGGGISLVAGYLQASSAQSLDPEVRQGRLDQANYKFVGGAALIGMGLCTLALSGLMWQWQSEPTLQASLTVDPHGGFFALSGRWP